jgi:hypothetical protein
VQVAVASLLATALTASPWASLSAAGEAFADGLAAGDAAVSLSDLAAELAPALAIVLIASPFASPLSLVVVANVLTALPWLFPATAVNAPPRSTAPAAAAIVIDRNINQFLPGSRFFAR